MAFFLLQFVVRYIFLMDFCYHICTYRKLVLSLHRVIKNTVMGSIVKFTKMHGAGNDYIYINTLLYNIVDPAKAAQVWSLPHYAIGSDGLILIGEAKSKEADFSMRIFNNDGSEAKMCGNGARCVARYLHDKHLTDKSDIRLETLSGIKVLHLNIADGTVKDVTVDMGEPADMKPLTTRMSGTYVSMGNPHFVIFVDDVEHFDVSGMGSVLEHDPLFPDGCNIEFVERKDDGTLRMRVWERGSGITMACGTGACATAVAACLAGKTGRESDVRMDGGTLHIVWNEADNHIYMTGGAEITFEGEIALPKEE